MISNEEERGNKRRELDDEGDEDWLRYSPPQQQPEEAAADVATESDQPMSVEVAEEKIISRFISEIEGDCMPVTGPGGDRVYAKMSSGLAVGGPMRLHREKSANGWWAFSSFFVLIRYPFRSLCKFQDIDAKCCIYYNPKTLGLLTFAL